MLTLLKGAWNNLVSLTNTVNITNAKIIAVIICMFMTAIKVLYLPTVLGIVPDSTLMIWCGFLLSMAGVAAWTYGKKRTTSFDPNDDDDTPPAPTK